MSHKPGDWTCPDCGEHKFATKTECQCGGKRPVGAGPQLKKGDWMCPKCQDHQFAKNKVCRKCGGPRPAEEHGEKKGKADEDSMEVESTPTGGGRATLVQPSQHWYLAVDIEVRGDAYYYPVCAIGVYLARVNGDTSDAVKLRWAVKALPGQIDEESCQKEFWDKYLNV